MMINIIEDLLFHTLVMVGMVALIATVFWWFLLVLNRIFKITRFIIMYQNYKRNKELYNLKNKLVISKDGHISYSCISDLDEKIEILNKAIKKCNEMKQLRGKSRK